MAEMIKAIKLTPRGPNVHLKLSDVLSQGSIILGFPSLSDEQVSKSSCRTVVLAIALLQLTSR